MAEEDEDVVLAGTHQLSSQLGHVMLVFVFVHSCFIFNQCDISSL